MIFLDVKFINNMALSDKYGVPIWSGTMAGHIISRAMHKFTYSYIAYHRQCGCETCDVMYPYSNLINWHNQDEILLMNLDNIVVQCFDEMQLKHNNPKYITLKDSVFKLKDAKKILDCISEYLDQQMELCFCKIVNHEVGGFYTRFLVISFYIVNGKINHCPKEYNTPPPPVDTTRLTVPRRNIVKYPFVFDDVIKGDNRYNGIPRYFLEHLIDNGQNPYQD